MQGLAETRTCYIDGQRTFALPRMSAERKAKRIRHMLKRYGSDERLSVFYMNALRATTGKDGGAV